jgi:hypothetical protein
MKSHPVRTRRSRSGVSRSNFTRRLTFLALFACAVIVAVLSGGGSGLAAQDNASGARVAQKKYKATRPLTVDRDTRALRMPTQEEVDETVSNLLRMTNRPSEMPQLASAETGTITVDLEGGFAGVLLARPNEDGSWETKCVFTFEEGIDFLGLVPDAAQ